MSRTLSALVARTARAVAPAPAATDGELLRRFARTRDESAFAELVARLGPLVLGACLRVVPDRHAAEDAFQAAFLVLLRRAADVRPAEAVRGWLYGVAVRCAKEARAVNARRRRRETPVPTLPERAAQQTEPPDPAALAALDEAVAQLPEHLRAAVVLCELEGLSRREAAGRLGVAEGTLSSRLAKARKLLAERLRARGVALSVAGLTALGHVAVSPQLLAQTSALVSAGAAVPPAVAALTSGVFRTMFAQKLRVASPAAVLVVGALAAFALAGDRPDAPRPAPRPVPKPVLVRADEPKPKPAPRAGVLLVSFENGPPRVVDPSGKKLHDLTRPDKTGQGFGALSPDGTRAAVLAVKEDPPRVEVNDDPWPFVVAVWTLGKGKPDAVFDLPAHGLWLSWAADGKRLVAAKTAGRHPDQTFESVLLDPATGKADRLDLPAGVRVLDCGRDGKTFVVETWDKKAKKNRIGLATLGKSDVTDLTGLSGYPGEAQAALSPDGKRLLLIDADPDRKDAHKWGSSQRVYRVEVATGKREPLAEFPDNGQALGIGWSPDGKKVAYCWKQLHDELLKKDQISATDAEIETEAFVIVADPDGKNPKTVLTEKGRYAINSVLGPICWR